MENDNVKIKFKKAETHFYADLKKRISELLTIKVVRRAERLVILKFIVYASLFLGSYALIFINQGSTFLLFTSYIAIGLLGILLAFNGGHDAVHDIFSKNKKVNRAVFFGIFTIQGVNASLWRKRHIASHHLFPNVDGCDADIDDNPFLRLSKTHPLKPRHKFQHIYAPFIYCLYTLQWVLFKDFNYLGKTELANMKNFNFTLRFKLEVVALKIAYFVFILFLPWYFTDFGFGTILTAFLVMHVVTSLFLVCTLIISHLCMETDFPVADINGMLPYDYYEHQLAVSLDFHPTSKFANWIFGGFNSHAAHHLFPKLPPTLYTKITPAIQELAFKYNLPYNVLPMHKAIFSHIRFLRMLGRG